MTLAKGPFRGLNAPVLRPFFRLRQIHRNRTVSRYAVRRVSVSAFRSCGCKSRIENKKQVQTRQAGGALTGVLRRLRPPASEGS